MNMKKMVDGARRISVMGFLPHHHEGPWVLLKTILKGEISW